MGRAAFIKMTDTAAPPRRRRSGELGGKTREGEMKRSIVGSMDYSLKPEFDLGNTATSTITQTQRTQMDMYGGLLVRENQREF